ncbi:MAG: hypothetical protein ACKOGP_05970 [Bacteroidota bacterium]
MACNFVRLLFGFFSLVIFGHVAFGQTEVRITGFVTDNSGQTVVPNLMVVNKRTQQGQFSGMDGRFVMSVRNTDTIIVAATGFYTIKIAVADSISTGVNDFKIRLNRLQVNLKEVEIFTNRDMEAIEKDIQTLGYDEREYLLDGVDAISSPITAVYMAFSRREQSKRLVAEMRNNDRRRALLKELFRKYVDYDIIQLNNDEFDRFIDFCRVSDEFLKGSTQYDFIMYVKKRFEVYRMLER